MKLTLNNLTPEQLLIVNDPRPNLFVALNTGVGKTISTLYAIHYKHPKAKILVIVPKTLRDDKSWEKDLNLIEIDLDITVLSKEDFKSKQSTLTGYDVLVIDEACDWLLSGIYPNLRSSNRVKYIDGSQIFANVESYIKREKPKHIYMLDATPLAHKPMHLWGAMLLMGFLDGRDRIASHQQFVKYFYIEIAKGYSHIYIEKTKETRHITFGETLEFQKEYKNYWKDIAIFADDDRKIKPIETDIMVVPDSEHARRIKNIKIDFTDVLARRTRAFCIENGHYRDVKFDDTNHTQEIYKEAVPTQKEKVITDMILSLGQNQVIIFSTLGIQQLSIQKCLADAGIKSEIVNGQTKNRSALFNEFREGRLRVLIIQSSICVGYNIPDCKYLFRASPPIQAAHLDQQYGRIDRAPNYKQNYVYNFILQGGIDEKSFDDVKQGKDLQFSIKDDE